MINDNIEFEGLLAERHQEFFDLVLSMLDKTFLSMDSSFIATNNQWDGKFATLHNENNIKSSFRAVFKVA